MAQIDTLTNVGAVVSTDLALILRGGANVLGTFGSLVGQNATAVTITGGTVNGTVIGGVTAAAGSFTTGTFSSTLGVTGVSTLAAMTATTGTFSGAINGKDIALTKAAGVVALSMNASGYSSNWTLYSGAGGANALGFYDGSAYRLTINPTGIDVTGTVTADGLTSSGDVTLGSGASLIIDDQDSLIFGAFAFGSSGTLLQGGTSTAFDTYVGGKKRQTIASNGDVSFYEDTGTTAKMVWSASAESLGIGGSPTAPLDVFGNNAVARFNSVDANGNYILFASNAVAKAYIGNGNQIISGGSANDWGLRAENNLLFASGGGTERMTLDSSGNLLVGKSASSFASAGVEIVPDGRIVAGRAGETLILNRLTTDGDIALFRKDGTTVGSIGSRSGVVSYIALDPRSNGAGLSGNTNEILPATEAGALVSDTKSLGSSAWKFKDLYLSSGIYLGGTGAANLLSDYETGTWTPTIAFGGASVGVTYFAQQGYYTKVGRLVQATGKVYVNAVGSSTGDFTITGLPFNLSASANSETAVAIRTDAVSYADVPAAFITPGTSYITFTETTNAGTGSNLTNSNIAFGSLITFTASYFE